jgi:hypothetical protein
MVTYSIPLLVHQCVMSFCSHFQYIYGLLPLLTPRSSDPRSKHQRYSSCKQQHCYCLCLVDPLSLLLAAITIVVKKRLVNSITYFPQYYFCWNKLWFGIFALNHIQISIDNISVEDWGINEYNIKGSSIRKYFK